MQLNKRGGSMGLPEEVNSAINQHNEQQKMKEVNKRAAEEATELAEETEEQDSSSTEGIAKKVGASEILKRLNIEFTEEDMQQLLFRGFVSKEIEVVKGLLKATMKTLTTEEYDTVDSVATEELKNQSMSTNGFEARKSVLTVCFGVTHLNGKPLAVNKKPLREDGEVDLEAFAQSQRMVFKKMSGQVMDKIIETHGAFSLAINMILREPGDVLKNS